MWIFSDHSKNVSPVLLSLFSNPSIERNDPAVSTMPFEILLSFFFGIFMAFVSVESGKNVRGIESDVPLAIRSRGDDHASFVCVERVRDPTASI